MHTQDINEEMYAILANMCFHSPIHFFVCRFIYLLSHLSTYLSVRIVTDLSDQTLIYVHMHRMDTNALPKLKKWWFQVHNRLFTNEVPYCKVVEVCEKMSVAVAVDIHLAR